MSLPAIVTQLNTMLEEAGFDFAHADPQVAWQVFKAFSRLPLDSEELRAGSSGFEFTHYADRDDELWLSFSRDISFIGEDGKGVAATAVGCDFTHPVPEELIAINQAFSSSRFENLQQYFEAVERRPEFEMCMHLTGWKWEPTHWYWDTDEEEQANE